VPDAFVTFNYGKAPNRRVLNGAVIGIKPADPTQPTSYAQAKIAVGSGFDAEILTVPFASITAINPA
jgi:hypothetical protein